MLYRKITSVIEGHLASSHKEVLVVHGARQCGKTFIIRNVGKRLFKNFIEINMEEDRLGPRIFENARTVESFLFTVSAIAGNRLGSKKDTLIFIDEIQAYPHLFTLLKFLCDDGRYTYIASGSQLGVALENTSSIPIGYIRKVAMFPLDAEEFFIANGMDQTAIQMVGTSLAKGESLDENIHNYLMDLFKKYLLVGGLPAAVNVYLETNNISRVREVQKEIIDLYARDAAKYDSERRLKIQRIYSMIPSNMENKKKRIVYKEINGNDKDTFKTYLDEFDYLISSGIALGVTAITNPHFPLIESGSKNLIKLYLNDPGLLTSVLYSSNVFAVLQDHKSINLGSVYETVVACELKAHGFDLYYYDNRRNGEVDYLVDDYDQLSVLPIEVKSGKDYTVHSALSKFMTNPEYGIKRAIVLSNAREIKTRENITYMPIYYTMFLKKS